MPYIAQYERDRFDAIENVRPETSGELNYCITKLITNYHRSQGGRYAQANDVIGALEGAKLEFYRRVVAPYETVKQGENGDVY